MTEQSDWLRRAPWAVKMLVFFAAIVISAIAIRVVFALILRDSFSLRIDELTSFGIMWALFTAPYYVGWVIWCLLRRGRSDA